MCATWQRTLKSQVRGSGDSLKAWDIQENMTSDRLLDKG